MPKILIIRFSSIGDIVLTTPVIRCIKKQVPNAEVHFLTKQSFVSIIAPNPYVSKVWGLGSDWSLLETLKQEAFDVVIDLHHNLRTLKVKRALKAKAYSFNKLNVEKWLLTNFKINRLPAVHIVDRYLATTKELGVHNDMQGLDYFIPDEAKVSIDKLPAIHRNGYVGVVIGAALATKQLPLSKLEALCTAIEQPIVLLGGPEDAVNGQLLADINQEKIYNACGKFKLHESASLVQQAMVIVTHDTGLMHIAAAFKKPIVSIWGNTVPAFGMGPYYGNYNVSNAIFEVPDVSCRPCSKIGYKSCPKKHFKCMQLQPIEAIVAAVNKIWNDI
ncbi:MAG: glycosyltransferase family 9 protein [Chitinophagaceae bacterium]